MFAGLSDPNNVIFSSFYQGEPNQKNVIFTGGSLLKSDWASFSSNLDGFCCSNLATLADRNRSIS